MKYNIKSGRGGRECPHNGEHYDSEGRLIDCHCGECSEYLVCFGDEVLAYFASEIENRKKQEL